MILSRWNLFDKEFTGELLSKNNHSLGEVMTASEGKALLDMFKMSDG